MTQKIVKDPSDDRRNFDRYRVEHPFQTNYIRERQIEAAVLKNISASGAQFRTHKCCLSDNRVTLVFSDGKWGEKLIITGRVVWTKSNIPNLWDVGFEFQNISFRKVQKLFKLLGISL